MTSKSRTNWPIIVTSFHIFADLVNRVVARQTTDWLVPYSQFSSNGLQVAKHNYLQTWSANVYNIACFGKHVIEFFTIRLHLHFKPEFTSRSLNIFTAKKLSPVGIELTTLAITGSKVECLSKYSREACPTWRTLKWSLLHAPFHIWKIIKVCLM